MRLSKYRDRTGAVSAGILDGDHIRPLILNGGARTISDLLAAPDPASLANRLLDPSGRGYPRVVGHPPAADRSPRSLGRRRHLSAQQDRPRGKSALAGGASFYDKVYTASRPELFLKATASRVVGPGQPIRAGGQPLDRAGAGVGAGHFVGHAHRRLYDRQRRECPRHRGRESALLAAGEGLQAVDARWGRA